jgi:hypothetical protein
MANHQSKWESVTQTDPAFRAKISRLNQRRPIATIELKIYSTREGDSTAQVDISPDGPFGARQAKSLAPSYRAFAAICQRELQSALAAWTSLASQKRQ